MTAVYIVLIGLLTSSLQSLFAACTINNWDPYPLWAATNENSFMTRNERYDYRSFDTEYTFKTHFRFAGSVFRQSADMGTNMDGVSETELGDLIGKWNVLGLFYREGDVPEGTLVAPSEPSNPPPPYIQYDLAYRLINQNTVQPLSNYNTLDGLTLSDAQKQKIFSRVFFANPADPAPSSEIVTNLAEQTNIDANHQFGFFSVPMYYRKYGARFELEFGHVHGFGMKLQFGVADILQRISFDDLTCEQKADSCNGTNPDTCEAETCCTNAFDCDTKQIVIEEIMDNFKCTIAPILDLCVSNYHTVDIEDVVIQGYWRTLHYVNMDRNSWADFIIMPFIQAYAWIPMGAKRPFNWLTALPTGNNGHVGVGSTMGATIDFRDTIEIGMKAGFTHFFSENHCNVPFPTDCQQSKIYPRQADMCIKPGTTWNFGFILNAYHFLDRLNFYGEYAIITHKPNCFVPLENTIPQTLPCPEPPCDSEEREDTVDILTGKMAIESSWEVQLANLVLSYDVSPNISLGFAWQAPIKRRNAYQSNTVVGTLEVWF